MTQYGYFGAKVAREHTDVLSGNHTTKSVVSCVAYLFDPCFHCSASEINNEFAYFLETF